MNTSSLVALAKCCHEYGVPLIVDEAHGSHLRFLNLDQYQDAIACGADVAIQSTHKTLTSLSQTAMMHVGPTAFQYSRTTEGDSRNAIRDEQENAIYLIQQYYSMLTTTSANGKSVRNNIHSSTLSCYT